jgi:hypothetical protein
VKALNWIKENWWKVFLPLIALFGFIAAVLAKLRPAPVVIDPTAEADERAKIEAETRAKAEKAEAARLGAEINAIHAETAASRTAAEDAQAAEVDTLRKDSSALRDRMLRTGRGE